MSNVNQRIGVLKRQSRASAKKLVREYVDNGIHENYGRREVHILTSKIPSQLSFQEELHLREQIVFLIRHTSEILFSSGRGNTEDKDVRRQLAREAMSFIEDFVWE